MRKLRKLRLRKFDFGHFAQNTFKKNGNQEKSPIKSHRNLKTILSRIMLVLIVLAVLGGSAGVIYIATVISGSPTMNPDDFLASDSSKIYDSEGNLVADVGFQIRENISYDDLPQSVIDAFVAIEDSRFFEHNGFDLPRFTKAILENLKTLSFGQGGSTFTMQLVKGTYFETEEATAVRSGLAGVNRKIREIYVAMKTETALSKKRILELYLNKINYGVPGNKRGIQTAAQYYFGKDVSELNLTEAAMLAGVINAPNAYNPLKNLDLAQQRTETVLDLMVYHGYITQEEAELAKSIPLENLLIGDANNNKETIPYQAYVDAVVAEVFTLTGLDPVNVPMRIYTSMDRDIQESIEAIENGEIETVAWPNDIIQTAIVTMNNQTGEIIGIGGGRFYNGERLMNRVTDMRRQPGSSAKTILTYPLAFEYLGWSTQHMLEDKPIQYAGIDVIIKNFDGVYRGDILLSRAIGMSLNIPAIETMTAVVDTIGVKKVVSYMNSVGFTEVTNQTFDIGYAIGGSTFEASPLQMAGANAAMINSGNYIQPHTVTRIEFLDGTEPITPTYTETSAISPEAAYMTTMMMEQDVTGPYSNFMQILKRNFQVYAKTGTSDWGDTGVEYGIPKGSAKDKWMIASTSEFTTAVWVGYDKAVKDQQSYLTQSQINLNLPGKINNAVLTALYKTRKAPANVSRPSDVVDVTHIMGIYPYVAPNESTNPSLVVTGLIKSEYANLSTLNSPSLNNPSTFTGTVTNNGTTKTFAFTINDYPDPNALNVALGTKDYSLTVGNQTVTATGTRLFDYSWIYGPVRYKLNLNVDGVLVDTLTSTVGTFTITKNILDTSTVTGCGYYGYEYAMINSSELCKTFKMSDFYLTVPDFTGKTIDEFNTWMTENKIKHTSDESLPSDATASQLGLIASVTSNAGTNSLDLTKLDTYTFKATVVDKDVELYKDFVGKPASTRPIYCAVVTCTGPKSGTINSVKFGSTTATSGTIYKLSEMASGITYTTTNTAPIVSNPTVNVKKNLPETVAFPASDAENDPLTFTITQNPTKGTITDNGNGTYTYTPNDGVTGTDTIKFKANDGTLDSVEATITFSIN